MLLKTDLKHLNASRLALGLPNLNSAGLPLVQLKQEFANTRNFAINSINATNGQLPSIPFPEIHPYPLDFPFNPAYNISIVGTFPPVSYLLDIHQMPFNNLLQVNGGPIRPPVIPFYHGNRNSLWDLLGVQFRDLDNRIFSKEDIVNWLNNRGVNYFDIISECQRKRKPNANGGLVDYSTDDDALHNIIPNYTTFDDWYNTLNDQSLVIFNTSSAFTTKGIEFYVQGNKQGQLKLPKARSFDILLHIATQTHNNISLSLDGNTWYDVKVDQRTISQNWKTKIIFYLKINDRQCVVITGPSPSGAARRGNANNPCYLNYLNIQPLGYGNQFDDFRKYIYDMALNRDFDKLFNLNVNA